jgi:hypothetical protein
MLKHSLALLAVAGAAVVLYNGHAGLGTAQAANIQDGTSNTVLFGEVVAGGRGSNRILMADMGGQVRANARP